MSAVCRMGLGKTLQTLSLFAYLREQGLKVPHLIICPLSVLGAWITVSTSHASTECSSSL